jgi:hypothetical protein
MVGVLCKLPFTEVVAKAEFGASGHCRISTSDVSKIAAGRPFSKMRQCANEPDGRDMAAN